MSTVHSAPGAAVGTQPRHQQSQAGLEALGGAQLAPGRRLDIDALRVLAFMLLILYHCGMFYVADWGWHVKSAHQSEGLQSLMLLVNQWRMALLFLISGLASAFLLRREGGVGFARSRLQRLLPPLLLGMWVVVVPQAYYQGLSNGAFDYGYLEFYQRYLSLQDWPAGAFDGWDFGWTWNHLWFLPYVLSYGLILALLSPLLNSRPGQTLLGYCRRAPMALIYLAPMLWIWGLGVWLRLDNPETHNFFRDWYIHSAYFSVFLFGYILGNSRDLWQKLSRWRGLSLGFALLGYFGILWGRAYLPPVDQLERQDFIPIYAWLAFNAWAWLCAVLGYAHRYLNRPFKYLSYASEAVISWYILHQTITVVAGYYLARWSALQAMPGAGIWEAMLLISITVFGCWSLHEFVIRRLRWLRPLFGLKALRITSA